MADRTISYREVTRDEDPARLIENAFITPTRQTVVRTLPGIEPVFIPVPLPPIEDPMENGGTPTTQAPVTTTGAPTAEGIGDFLTKPVSVFGFQIPMFVILGGVALLIFSGKGKR